MIFKTLFLPISRVIRVIHHHGRVGRYPILENRWKDHRNWMKCQHLFDIAAGQLYFLYESTAFCSNKSKWMEVGTVGFTLKLLNWKFKLIMSKLFFFKLCVHGSSMLKSRIYLFIPANSSSRHQSQNIYVSIDQMFSSTFSVLIHSHVSTLVNSLSQYPFPSLQRVIPSLSLRQDSIVKSENKT